jgi:hypothetical protein
MLQGKCYQNKKDDMEVKGVREVRGAEYDSIKAALKAEKAYKALLMIRGLLGGSRLLEHCLCKRY